MSWWLNFRDIHSTSDHLVELGHWVPNAMPLLGRASSIQYPVTSNQQPAASNQQPATSNQ
jgi:hypothetical protein